MAKMKCDALLKIDNIISDTIHRIYLQWVRQRGHKAFSVLVHLAISINREFCQSKENITLNICLSPWDGGRCWSCAKGSSLAAQELRSPWGGSVVVVVVVVVHLGVAVADGDGDDATEHVEVPPALVVPQPLHAALVDQQGRPVVGRHGRVQVLLPDLLRLLHRRPLILGGIQKLGFLAPTSRGADRTTGYQPRWSNRQPHYS